MQFEHDNDNSVDTFVATLLRKRGQSISRRGCSSAGKGLLGVVGISLVPVLPLDRTFALCAGWSLLHMGVCESRVIFVVPPAQAHAQVTHEGASWSKCLIMATAQSGKQNGRVHGLLRDYVGSCNCDARSQLLWTIPALRTPGAPKAEFYGCTYVKVGNTCSGGSHNPC